MFFCGPRITRLSGSFKGSLSHEHINHITSPFKFQSCIKELEDICVRGRLMKENDKALETALCGGIAGLVSRFFIAPLDVLKIRMQLSSRQGGLGENRYGSTVGSLRTILGEEGVRALWKGNVPAEWLYVTYSATQFLTYSSILTPITEGTGVLVGTFIAGAVAGTVATTVTYPFDLLRTRFAIHQKPNPLTGEGTTTRTSRVSLLVVTRDVVRQEGVRGMYRGLGASITQIIPYMGLLFGTYEPTKRALQGLGITRGWEDASAGFIAGTLSKTGVFPLDLIRKRIQVQGPSRLLYVLDVPFYSSSLSCAAQIWRKDGLRGFYKGLSVSLLKSAPSSAITLWTFQQSHNLLRHVQRKLGVAAQ